MEIANAILAKISSKNNYADVTYEELIEVRGLGMAGAAKIIACFELARRSFIDNTHKSSEILIDASNKIYKLLKPYYFNESKEILMIVSLNSRNKVIAIDKVSIGTVNQSLVHPREVFETAIKRRASYFVVSHNHPSNDVNPSDEDIQITNKLYELSKLIGIPLIDHIIMSRNEYFSFKDNNKISKY
jgi:DNA repair protein RadC